MLVLVLICWIQNCSLRYRRKHLPFPFPSPMVEASLRPVCAILGHGVSRSSSLGSDAQGWCRRPHSWPRRRRLPSPLRLNVWWVKCPSTTPACHLTLLPPAAPDVSCGPRIPFHFLLWAIVRRSLPTSWGPAATFQSEAASCTWHGSWFPLCLFPWCSKPSGLCFENSSINVKYH